MQSLKRSVRPLRIGMLKLLTGLLILNGCTSTPRQKIIERYPHLEWSFCEMVPMEEPKACLDQRDMEALTRELNNCKNSRKGY